MNLLKSKLSNLELSSIFSFKSSLVLLVGIETFALFNVVYTMMAVGYETEIMNEINEIAVNMHPGDNSSDHSSADNTEAAQLPLPRGGRSFDSDEGGIISDEGSEETVGSTESENSSSDGESGSGENDHQETETNSEPQENNEEKSEGSGEGSENNTGSTESENSSSDGENGSGDSETSSGGQKENEGKGSGSDTGNELSGSDIGSENNTGSTESENSSSDGENGSGKNGDGGLVIDGEGGSPQFNTGQAGGQEVEIVEKPTVPSKPAKSTLKRANTNYPGCDGRDFIVGDHTIAACNVGANSEGRDENAGGNVGFHFQWGNGYGWSLSTSASNIMKSSSATAQNVIQYGPTNPYSQRIWSTLNPRDTTPANKNLWGGLETYDDQRKGPCADGYHVPTVNEWQSVVSEASKDLEIQLSLPFGGYRAYANAEISNAGVQGYFWTANRGNSTDATIMSISSSSASMLPLNISNGVNVRCFADVNITPVSQPSTDLSNLENLDGLQGVQVAAPSDCDPMSIAVDGNNYDVPQGPVGSTIPVSVVVGAGLTHGVCTAEFTCARAPTWTPPRTAPKQTCNCDDPGHNDNGLGACVPKAGLLVLDCPAVNPPNPPLQVQNKYGATWSYGGVLSPGTDGDLKTLSSQTFPSNGVAVNCIGTFKCQAGARTWTEDACTCDGGYTWDGNICNPPAPVNCPAGNFVVKGHTYSLPTGTDGNPLPNASINLPGTPTNGETHCTAGKFICLAGAWTYDNNFETCDITCNSGYTQSGSSCVLADVTPPTAVSFGVNNMSNANPYLVNTGVITLKMQATDNIAVTHMCVNEAGGPGVGIRNCDSGTNGSRVPYATTMQHTLAYRVPIGDEHRLYVHYKDAAGNTTSNSATMYTDVIMVKQQSSDATPPVISSMTILGGNTQACVNSTSVTIDLQGTDNVGVTHVCFSNTTSNSSCTWVAKSTYNQYSRTLNNSTIGTKTVYGWMKDAAGNVSSMASDTIIFDNTPPVVSLSPNGNNTPAKNQSSTITVTNECNTYPVLAYHRYSSGTEPTPPDFYTTNFVNGASVTQNGGDGYYYLYIHADDAAGNITNVYNTARFKSNAFLLDNTAPTLSSINIGDPVSGTYKAGQTILFQTTRNEPLGAGRTSSSLTIKFGNGANRTATHDINNAGSLIQYSYTIQTGDNGTLSLVSLAGASLADEAGNSANLTIPALGGKVPITADTTAPVCGSWTYSAATATLAGSTDAGAGIATAGGSCSRSAQGTCNVTISDTAGNTTVCTSPAYTVGVCGTANNTNASTKPSTNLCNYGTNTTVAGSGPRTWNCNGDNGGGNASCQTNAFCASQPSYTHASFTTGGVLSKIIVSLAILDTFPAASFIQP